MNAQAARSARQTEMFKTIKEYQKSDVSQNQFCEENNLSKSTFLYWLKKYRKEKSSPEGFIPLNISQPNSDGVPRELGGDYRIELPNGIRIQLDGPEGLELIANIISKTVNCHAAL